MQIYLKKQGKKVKIICGKCFACGELKGKKARLDNNHRLAPFIKKNPPKAWDDYDEDVIINKPKPGKPKPDFKIDSSKDSVNLKDLGIS
jgi:hypothetical protein